MALDTTIALIDFAFMKAQYGYDDSDQDKVEGFINELSSLSNKYTGHNLKAVDTTEVISTNQYRQIVTLKNYPINSISKVYHDESHSFPESTLLSNSSYGYDADSGLLYLYHDLLYPNVQNLKVIYNGGFTVVPYDLQGAIGEAVVWLMKRRGNSGNQIGEKTTTLTSVQTTFETTLPLNVRLVLDRYIKGR